MAEGPVKVEPTSDQRQIALVMFQFYTALIDQGFAEAQAVLLVAEMFRPKS